jgi:hypothetical protein
MSAPSIEFRYAFRNRTAFVLFSALRSNDVTKSALLFDAKTCAAESVKNGWALTLTTRI